MAPDRPMTSVFLPSAEQGVRLSVHSAGAQVGGGSSAGTKL